MADHDVPWFIFYDERLQYFLCLHDLCSSKLRACQRSNNSTVLEHLLHCVLLRDSFHIELSNKNRKVFGCSLSSRYQLFIRRFNRRSCSYRVSMWVKQSVLNIFLSLKFKLFSQQMRHRAPVVTCGLFTFDFTLLFTVSTRMCQEVRVCGNLVICSRFSEQQQLTSSF
jgi:hypothetical protein